MGGWEAAKGVHAAVIVGGWEAAKGDVDAMGEEKAAPLCVWEVMAGDKEEESEWGEEEEVAGVWGKCCGT